MIRSYRIKCWHDGVLVSLCVCLERTVNDSIQGRREVAKACIASHDIRKTEVVIA